METDKTPQESKEHKNTWHHGAHSGTRSGLADYNDGGNVTHYLGNDEFQQMDDSFSVGNPHQEFDGKEALGNDITEEDINFSSLEKRHSGL